MITKQMSMIQSILDSIVSVTWLHFHLFLLGDQLDHRIKDHHRNLHELLL